MHKLKQHQKRAINAVITLGLVSEYLEKLEEYVEDLPASNFKKTKQALSDLQKDFSSEVNEEDYYE